MGSGGFKLGFELWTSTTVFVSGVPFAGTWEIGASSAVVREFGAVTSIVGVEALGVIESLEGV